jgi:uncharacterized protein GlcG (DUF336 family)
MPHYPPNGLRLAQADAIADAALAKGRALNLQPLTVVVLDAGGQIKVVKREDGCSLMRVEIATGKAFGALALGVGSRELAKRSQNPQMQGFVNALSDLSGGRAVPVPGGVLACGADGAILGAVGISGDVSLKDEECCVAGIEAAGLKAENGE